MYQSQKTRVLNYLEKNQTISSMECFLKLNITDLQHAIMELRKEGYVITDKWMQKKNSRGQYKVYRLEVQ